MKNPLSRPRKVLVVDDNVDAVTTLASLLGAYGFEAREATSGAQALRKAPAFRPEVVLMDLGMPEMDGFEAAARLREQEWAAEVKVIAVTGYGHPEDLERTRNAGFAAHFTKPLDVERLVEYLEEGD